MRITVKDPRRKDCNPGERSLKADVMRYSQRQGHALSSRSQRPAISDPPHATVSSMMVLPASVPIPTLTCSIDAVRHTHGNLPLVMRRPDACSQVLALSACRLPAHSLEVTCASCGHEALTG